MIGRKYNLLTLLFALVVATNCFLPSCGQKVPELANEPAPQIIPSSNPDSSRYTNDLDRLGKLSDRINGVCRGAHAVVLGDDSTASGPVVTIDYATFDRLSDDGAAVLIAEAIVAKSVSPAERQTPANSQRHVLQIDETAGRYVAKAGFGADGFAEWLAVKKAVGAGLEENSLPDSLRVAAFMRGYLSARPNQGNINTRDPKSVGG
ncbi:MAG: hypothetical protein ACYTEX_26355 [Planctomycetota bacterium]|jgi:hypothetical protein